MITQIGRGSTQGLGSHRELAAGAGRDTMPRCGSSKKGSVVLERWVCGGTWYSEQERVGVSKDQMSKGVLRWHVRWEEEGGGAGGGPKAGMNISAYKRLLPKCHLCTKQRHTSPCPLSSARCPPCITLYTRPGQGKEACLHPGSVGGAQAGSTGSSARQ